ncbi:MAG: signal peptidase I [Clostridia bacterium]|nr:signal peptidase I [Clostridia bacterium]
MLKKQEKIGKVQSEAFEWMESIVFALVIVVLIFTFLFRAVQVDGTSMVPTLQDKDKVILFSAGYTPKNGDIVVLTEENGFNKPLIKRVIAVGGQTINIDPVNHIVYVDDVPLHEPYIAEPIRTAGDAYTYPLTIPEGKVFCMGDNRNHSSDSRSSLVGMIDNEKVMGKVLFRYAPLSSFGGVYKYE